MFEFYVMYKNQNTDIDTDARLTIQEAIRSYPDLGGYPDRLSHRHDGRAAGLSRND